MRRGEERLAILARLEHKFHKVDLDRSKQVPILSYLFVAASDVRKIQIDFYEFMYLVDNLTKSNPDAFILTGCFQGIPDDTRWIVFGISRFEPRIAQSSGSEKNVLESAHYDKDRDFRLSQVVEFGCFCVAIAEMAKSELENFAKGEFGTVPSSLKQIADVITCSHPHVSLHMLRACSKMLAAITNVLVCSILFGRIFSPFAFEPMTAEQLHEATLLPCVP
eukprot:758536-Hanusia_phi.AAC.1